MKLLLKKTAVLWIAAVLALVALYVPFRPRARAADPGNAYITVELLPLAEVPNKIDAQTQEITKMVDGLLCGPAKIAIVSGETAAQTLMRFLSANGYTAFYSGTATKGYHLGYIADGDKADAYKGFTSSLKDYPVKTPQKIAINGQLSTLAQAMLGTYGVKWDPEKDKVAINGYLGEKDITPEAGWVFSLNNGFVTSSLDTVKLKNNDTLRVQFTLANGKDLGYLFGPGEQVRNNGADRSQLIRLVADYADNHADSVLYDRALEALGRVTLTADDVSTYYGGLKKELNAPDVPTAAPTSTTAATTSTTAAPTSTTAAPTSTTAAPTSTTAAPTSTTAAPTSTTAAPTSTTAAPTTTKKNETTTAAPSTTKKNETTTASSSAVTVRQYSPLTTTNPNQVLTTVLGATTLPGETTTIERPTGIVLQHMSKELPETEPETTAPEEETEATATDAPASFIDKLKGEGTGAMVRNIAIVGAAAVVIGVISALLKKKMKKKL